ncbi:MAG TPA: 4Fe-4S ferredoxin [Gammaproteobacteria bacterium]|nr:4Fe-4S ferredoxin [Gammaproteobacteria bacterium]
MTHAAVGEPGTQSLPLQAVTRNGQARQAALRAYSGYTCAPTPGVAYCSSGRLLIVGPIDQALPLAQQAVQAGITACHLVTLAGDKPDKAARAAAGRYGITFSCGEVFALTGYLGAFQYRVREQGDANGVSGTADLVLDLGPSPLFEQALPPFGYQAAGEVDADPQAALSMLTGLVGEFEKPQYFRYDASICAHGRSGITACTRCLDTCPTGAIQSLGEQIQVDPYLCQGAGSCATACPSGAITYRYPDLADTLTRLRRLLETYRESGGERPVVLFHDRENGVAQIRQQAADLAENLLPVEVEEIGSVGLDSWLSALAFGAEQVGLLQPPGVVASVWHEVELQLTVGRAMIAGMGYAPDLLRPLTEADLTVFGTEIPAGPARDAGRYAGLDEKRSMLHLAIEHLYRFAPAPRPLVNLPQGAPFGEAWVDAERCTLCMACVSQCPGRALQAGDELPRLTFIEANCVQCGLCCRSCPEDAIAISPRYLFDSGQRRIARVLNEEQPFPCVVCGKPFATRSMIRHISRQMGQHPMFQGAAARRLEMCEDCRVRDMMLAELPESEGNGP